LVPSHSNDLTLEIPNASEGLLTGDAYSGLVAAARPHDGMLPRRGAEACHERWCAAISLSCSASARVQVVTTVRRLFASLNRGGPGPGNFLLNPFLGPKERDSLNASW